MDLYSQKHAELAKQPTLFLHGNLASSIWWGPALQEWRNRGSMGSQPILLADWRGSGQNPDWSAQHNFSLEDLAADCLELLEKEKLHDVAVVAHSLGGLIATQMALLAPKMISKMVLLDPVGVRGVVFDDAMYEAFRQMAASPELTRTVILSTIVNGESLSEDFKSEIARDAFKAVKGIGTSVLEILKTTDLSAAVSHLQTPTLILHGEKDAIIPLNDSIETARLMANAHLEVIENQGHCWNVEDPRAFTARVREFLS